ncbi:MAG: hypothetical protein WBG92_12890 [Thiohalocapsa sp.]
MADFGKIAEGGFTKTVDGSFFQNPFTNQGAPNLVDNIDGQTTNTYAWSGAAKDGKVYIGTNIDAVCLGTGNSDCAVGAESGAQIWKYTPSPGNDFGDWGLSGTWAMVFQSPPAIPGWLLTLGEVFGFDLSQAEDLPRDFGYRNMALCETADRTERLYATTLGLPGNVLYQRTTWWGGETFQPSSTVGLNASLIDLANGGLADLGYRSIVCFKGRVITAPAGSAEDPDAPITPTILMNPNPTNATSPWVEIANVAEHPDLGDPNNLGVFQIEAVGDYLYASTINRVDGFELWQGDGTDCVEPWVQDGHCNISWSKVIDAGGGRPFDIFSMTLNNDFSFFDPNQAPEFIASAIATLGVFGNDLYLGASESGFTGVSFVELIRVKNAHLPNPTWTVNIGWPRQDYGTSGPAKPANFVCENDDDMADNDADLGVLDGFFWQAIRGFLEDEFDLAPGTLASLPLIPFDNDGDADDCFPTSNAGPGFADNLLNLPFPDQAQPYSIGAFQYFWRFAQYLAADPDVFYLGGFEQLNLFVGGLNAPRGFDLLKTTDGNSFDYVTRDGFGTGPDGSNAYGVRTLFEVAGLGLVVGTANPDSEQGTDVFIGTRAPTNVPPHADAGPDQLLRDADPIAPTTVETTLNAGGSHSSFDGGTAISCTWFSGSADAGCSGDLTQLDGPVDCTDDVLTGGLETLVDGNRNPEYPFTVQVTGEQGTSCDTVIVTASSNRSPTAQLLSSVPLDNTRVAPPFMVTSGQNSSPRPIVSLVDFDSDGAESYQVQGVCDDPDGGPISVCEFVVRDAGNEVSDQALLCADGATTLPGLPPCKVTATITTGADIIIAGPELGGPTRPDMYLWVEDENRLTRIRWESTTKDRDEDIDFDNDRAIIADGSPECRSIVKQTSPGKPITIDPTAILGDGNPTCIDPNGDPMTFAVLDPQFGPFATGATAIAFEGDTKLVYDPGNASIGSFDKFEFEASDGSSSSRDVAVRIEIVSAPFDADGNGVAEAATDGRLMTRAAWGRRGTALTNGAVGAGCVYCDSDAIIANLVRGVESGVYDIDGDGSLRYFTDVRLIERYLAGRRGSQLTWGAVGRDCTRCSASAIAAYCDTLVP